jgi:hypothetical protein
MSAESRCREAMRRLRSSNPTHWGTIPSTDELSDLDPSIGDTVYVEDDQAIRVCVAQEPPGWTAVAT